MSITDHICSEVNLPFCTFICKDICKNSSRSGMLFNYKVYSPVLLGFLFTNIGLTIRMINHVEDLCSAIGRTEMKFFYFLYILSNVLQLFTVSFKDYLFSFHSILILCQLTITNMALFSLVLGSYTQDMFHGMLNMESTTVLYLFTLVYGIISGIVYTLGILLRNYIPFLVMYFILNGVFVFFYLITELYKLKHSKGEIWAYGTIFIAFTFYLISLIPLFTGSKIIAILSDKYIDNLFLHNLFLFCAVVMIHKFWLSVYDYEVECLLLEI